MDVRMDNGDVVKYGSREYFNNPCKGRHPDTTHLIKLFAWSHLPENLQDVGYPIGGIAFSMVSRMPDGPELFAGLRKLLEARDCFVRAEVDRVSND